MFKKIALVAMLAAGSLQAAEASAFTKYVTTPATKTASFAKNTVLGCDVTFEQIEKPMDNKAAIATSTINTVSRIALLTQVIRAGLAAIKAEKGEKVEAAKKILNTLTTKAAATAAVLAVLCPKAHNWYTTPKVEKQA